MDICVYCNSTTSDYESVFCVCCLYYIENIAQFKGGHCDYNKLEKYGDDADDIFYFVRRSRFNITTARLSFKNI